MHPQVRWIFRWQGIAMSCIALVAGVIGGGHAAISALAGGGIGVLSAAAYAWRSMRKGTDDPGTAFRAQVLGEGYKFAVTILLFALVFIGYREVEPFPLFAAYVLTFVVYWAALLKQG
jgi:ATP synthase protein I